MLRIFFKVLAERMLQLTSATPRCFVRRRTCRVFLAMVQRFEYGFKVKTGTSSQNLN